MTTEDAFVAAIVASPDDDHLRLVFADWLEERGDPRGEFIRLQIERARHPDRVSARRENELLLEYAEGWLSPMRDLLPDDHCTPEFHRGLVEVVTYWGGSGARHFLDVADELFRRVPLRELRLIPMGGQSRDPLPWNFTPRATFDRIGLAELRRLVAFPHLSHLRLLDLSANEIEQDLDVAVLASNQVGDEGARILAECPHLSGLRALHLRGCSIGDAGALAIRDSEYLKGLLTLDLSLNALSEEVVRALQQRFVYSLVV